MHSPVLQDSSPHDQSLLLSEALWCGLAMQLISWEAYSSAKKNGLLPAMLESLQQQQQGKSSNQSGKAKRPLDAVVSTVGDASAQAAKGTVTTQAIGADRQPPRKKLKSKLPNCRMMWLALTSCDCSSSRASVVSNLCKQSSRLMLLQALLVMQAHKLPVAL